MQCGFLGTRDYEFHDIFKHFNIHRGIEDSKLTFDFYVFEFNVEEISIILKFVKLVFPACCFHLVPLI